MDFTQMRYFCAVAEMENMTEASKKLFVPQPTLSVSLSKLEQELGTRLFDRLNNRIVLNETGKVFYARCLEMLSAQKNLVSEIHEIAAHPTKRISLVSTVQLISTELISCFMKEHPDYFFTQHLRDPQKAILMLRHGEADFAITNELEGLGNQFHYQPLVLERVYVALSKSHPLASRKSLHMAELAGERFCIYRPMQNEASEMDAYFQELDGVRDDSGINIVLIASEFELLMNAVSQNVGITLLSSTSVLSPWTDQYNEEVIYIPLVSQVIQRSIGFLWMKSHFFTESQKSIY